MPSYLDLALLGVVLVSALLSMVRGLTREVLAIASWAVAAVAAYYFHPLVMPYLLHYLPKDQIRMVAAIAIVFFATLIIVSIVTVKLSDAILDSRVGALDRTLGFVFGAARGFLLGVVAFVFFTWLAPMKTEPDWIATAKSRPLLQATGTELASIMPAGADGLMRFLQREKTAAPEDAPPDADPATTGTPGTGSHTETTPQPPSAPKASASAAPATDKPSLDALVGRVNGGTPTPKPVPKKQ